MTLATTVDFEEGTAGATPPVNATYLIVSGTNTYTASSKHGARALASASGGFVALPTPVSNFTISSYVRVNSMTSGSARVQTATDSANAFVGFTRMHNTGVFDICDSGSIRQALSTATWSFGTWYRLDTQFGGSGTARAVATKVFEGESTTPIWDSGAIAVTAASANLSSRVRIGCQGLTTGDVTTDTVRIYNSLEWPDPYAPVSPTQFAAFGVPL